MLVFDLPLFSTLSLTITAKIKHFGKQNHQKTLTKNGQKTCAKDLFLHILKKLAFSVLGHLSFCIYHHLEPAGDGVAQVLQHGLIKGDPQLLELGPQLGGGAHVLALQAILHNVPQVLDRVEIRAVARPVHHTERLLHQKRLGFLGGVAGRSVLKEICALVDLHEGKQVVLQGLLVPPTVHCGVFRQEEEASTSNSPRKTGPNHQALRMFHCFHSVAAVIAIGAHRPAHLRLPDAPERALIREHDAGPLLSGPVLVILGKSKPLLLHPCCGERLLSRAFLNLSIWPS